MWDLLPRMWFRCKKGRAEESQYYQNKTLDKERMADVVARYMLPLRNANSETGKPRLPFASDEQNTLSSLRSPSSTMKILCKTYSKVIAVRPTSV
jgi:hypothetical protein